MDVDLTPGKYVIAVSGGVDSMVLLDVVRRLPGVELTVAHFEHGIRTDADKDRQLVEQTARALGLPFVCEHGHLGADASEAEARAARYDFLRRVQTQTGARAILAAHHQNDVLETAIFNLLRGTGRKGLGSLRAEGAGIIRPFIHIYKNEIVAYARARHLVWREDSTNADERYARNYIRRQILPRLSESQRQQLRTRIGRAEGFNQSIDQLLDEVLVPRGNRLDRRWFIMLPHAVAREVMAAWLRRHGVRDFDRKTIERLVIVAKVASPGKTADITGEFILHIEKKSLEIRQRLAGQALAA